MAEGASTLAVAELRALELLKEEQSYRVRLSILRVLSWICVFAGIVFPLLAGSALLAAPEFFGKDSWARIGGLLILVAAVLTGLHKGFKCEAYHETCKQRIHTLRSLVEGYEGLSRFEGTELRAEMDKLEAKREKMRDTSFEVPPKRHAMKLT